MAFIHYITSLKRQKKVYFVTSYLDSVQFYVLVQQCSMKKIPFDSPPCRYTPALRRWNSPLVQAVLPVRVCTSSYICIHCLLFLWVINFKSLSFIYLSIYSFIYLCIILLIYLFIYLLVSLSVYLVICFCPGRATCTFLACCFIGYYFKNFRGLFFIFYLFIWRYLTQCINFANCMIWSS